MGRRNQNPKNKGQTRETQFTERPKRRRNEKYLTQKADGVAIESGPGEEGQPVLGPAPSCMKAAMDEDQRRVLWTRLLLLIRVGAEGTLLEDDFHAQT